MEFLFVIAFVVCFIIIYRLNNKIESQNSKLELQNHRIEQLNRHINDLYRKSLYNYEQIKSLSNIDSPPKQNINTQPKNVTEVVSTKQNETQNEIITATATESNCSNISTNISNNEVKSVNTAKPINPYATAQPPQASLAQNAPIFNQPQKQAEYSFAAFKGNQNRTNANRVSNSTPTKKPLFDKEKYKSIESWIGARLLNIAASLLVFIGLILFGTLDIVDQSVKIVGMHVLSIAVIAVGTMLTRKNKTIFSLGITGCGLGALFISILVTHIYFHAISDIVAFSLLLVWIFAALYISKILDSLMISITAHMGMAISVCFAFAGGLSDGRIMLPVIYQIISITVLIIGNIFCCKKTYRFGLLLSMGLIVFPAGEILESLKFSSNNLGGLSVGSIILLFSIQTLGLSFISYLLSVSTSKFYDSKETTTNTNIPIAIHILNKILWGIGICICAHDVVFLIMTRAFDVTAYSEPFMIWCIFPVLHLAVTLFMSEKLNFNEKLAKISIWFNSLYISILLIAQAEARRTVLVGAPLLFVFAAALVLIIKYTKNKKLNHLVTLVLGLDVLCMIFHGYGELIDSHLSFLAFIHIVIICLLVFIQWFNQKDETKEKYYLLFKTVEYVWLNIGIISVMCQTHLHSNDSFHLTLIIVSAINITAFICKYGGQERNYLNLIIKIYSIILIFVSLTQIAREIVPTADNPILPFVLRTVLILACAGLYYFIARECIKSNYTAAQIITGIIFAIFVDVICLGISDYVAIADFYTNTLSCRPFFFVLSVALLVILKLTKNDKLSICTLFPLGVDALITITVGFDDFVSNSLGALCFVYILYGCTMLYLLWRLQSNEVRQRNLLLFKTIAYYFIMPAFTSIIIRNELLPRSVVVSLVYIVLLAINILAIVLKYSGQEKNYLLKNIKIVSLIILFLSFLESANYIPASSVHLVLRYTTRIVLMLFCAAIYIILAADWVKSNSIIKQILTGLTFTVFVTAFCNGFTSTLSIAYVFSMICMVTALICVISGFALQAKGLRLYGLTIIIICVLKLVTIDISSANSTARVLALIVGGIICFVISGIYNHVEQKFSAKQTVSIETGNETTDNQ